MDRFRSRSSHVDPELRTRSDAASVAPARPPGPAHRSGARIAFRVLLLVAVAASSLTLTQCRMVGDKLTGIGVGELRRKDDCVRVCKDTYKDALKLEKDFHKAQVAACAGDPACLTEENARYAAAVQAIEEAFVACLNSCHSQGEGGVGP